MARIPGAKRIAGIWLNLSLPAKGGAVVAIPVICTIAMLYLLADVQRRFEASNFWIVHTEQVLSQSREILAASLSAEATARGYLLTREPAFLELHENARRRVSDGFSQILRLTEDNPGQQEHMRHAMRLMQDEVAALDAQFAAPASDLPAAVNVSRRRLDTLKAEVDAFDAEERRLLEERRLDNLRHRDRLRFGLWAFCFIGAVAAISGALLFTTSVRRRLERIAENADRFARRASGGAVDRSPDAIGRLEKTLIATTRNLLDREQRLSDNAAELERAKLAAEAAVKAKTEFVANISHEIRSPMNSLLGAAEMLGATQLSLKQREYVEMLDRAGNSLLSLVDEVLDHAKIEAGRLQLESAPFELAAAVDRVVKLMSVTASDKGLELLSKVLPNVPGRVVGDPARLQRVLINLVSNAIKFTDVGFVAIKVEPASDAGLLHFSVADTGIGIPRDRQEAIFQQFTQARASTTRHYGGTGLGLAIAKHIVELMDGRVWVESEEGAGSTFHFTAALAEAPEPAAPRVETQAAEPRANGLNGRRRIGARILLAEDSASSVSLIQAYLSESGCALEVASDGEAALSRLLEGRYNLVLMDAQMPKLDGYEVMRRFREWERAHGRPRTPIVAVTAHAFQEDIERALKAGADAQLTKPFRRDSLLEAIEIYQRPEGASDVRIDVPEFLRELAPEFLRRQRYGLLAVASALKSGEFDAIQSFAHNMKGCGKSFGFPRLTDLGRDMERAAKDRDAGSLRRQVEELREYLTEVDIA
jgi:signal transduction histidine kinase/DNA-binding response OmpR family regulator